jgi:hypothetical protein
MSNPTDILNRHRNLTEDLRTRTTKAMREELQGIATRNGWTLSDANREAVAEFVKKHRASKGKASR